MKTNLKTSSEMKEVIVDNDAKIMQKIRECLSRPSKFGHSDIWDALESYLRGKHSLAYFLWFCNVTYLGSKEEIPDEE